MNPIKSKIISIALFLCFSVQTRAQKIEKLLDYNLKETTTGVRYYMMTEKKDSLWHSEIYYIPERSVYMEGVYRDSSAKIKNGAFIYYYSNKKMKAQGNYINDKENGVWLRMHENGMLSDSATYENGMLVGERLQWHPSGYLSDSSFYNRNGSGMQISWFDDGKFSAAGLFSAGNKKNGRWKYFHRNEKLSAIEDYAADELTSRQYFDNNGNITIDTAGLEREATFPGGGNAWRKFLEKNLDPSVPIRYKAPAGSYIVATRFIVETDGSITGITSLTNFGFGMEKEAESILKKSPKWIPAMHKGRAVKAYRIQPLTFVIAER